MKRILAFVLGFGLAANALGQGLRNMEVVVIVKATNSQFWQYVLEGAKRAGGVSWHQGYTPRGGGGSRHRRPNRHSRKCHHSEASGHRHRPHGQ